MIDSSRPIAHGDQSSRNIRTRMIQLFGRSFARVWVETTSKNAPCVRDGGIGAENKDRSGCSSGSVCLPGILVSCSLIVVWSQCVVEVEVMVERDVSCVMLVVENAVSFRKIFYGGLCVAFQECSCRSVTEGTKQNIYA